ncbi:TetR/AcrR family transcriptional regulator [Telmatocola sphagniphila]|uniref:TetR/AcrR family transcriptional regulator n=1 Tax=Telmatocola sphagniphila TaxID=1123043 RepID=A0A8E6B4Q0_9BACT|nr:TetR/AcrR family transcriptional regulator [Telmatocola sphagniphila]QVL31394.1 TetR/AcrR family transcriptional regulator [Telmatocola sphagniphila]
MPWEKQFNESEALERAGDAFWKYGYEGISLNTLLEEMGIQKGSFYATYSSKHQVMLDSLEAYINKSFCYLDGLAKQPSPREALVEHFQRIAAPDCAGKGRGCYVVNMALEMAPKDPAVQDLIQKNFERHEECYRRALQAAQALGEIPAELDSIAVGRTLLALVFGMQVLVRAGAKPDVIQSVRDQAIRLLSGATLHS